MKMTVKNHAASFSFAMLAVLLSVWGSTLRAQELATVAAMGDSHVEEAIDEIRDDCRLLLVRITNDGLSKLKSLRGNKLKKVKAIEIHGHRISDNGLEALEHVDGIEELVIDGASRIDGSGLRVLEKLDKLERLEISGARRMSEDNLAPVWKLKGLESLTISRCPALTFESSAAIGDLAELRRLDISGTGVSDSGVKPVSNLNKLAVLNLSGCASLTNDGLDQLSGMKLLRSLNLKFCSGLEASKFASVMKKFTRIQELALGSLFDDEALKGLADMKNLVDLNVSIESRGDNWMHWYIAASRRSYATKIDVSDHYKIGDDGIAGLAGVQQISTINLQGCFAVTNNGIEKLKNLPNLRSLNLSGCIRVSRRGIKHIVANFPMLRELDLSNCERMQDFTLELLAPLKSLKRLDVRDCPLISKEAVEKLRKKLPNCEILSNAKSMGEMGEVPEFPEGDDFPEGE